MESLNILLHALRMVWRNLGDALKIALVPLLISEGALVLAAYATLGTMRAPDIGGPGDWVQSVPPGFLMATLLALLFRLLLTSWVAVAWHRFVLTSDYPEGWLPEWNLARVLRYIWSGFLVGLAVMGVILLASMVFVPLAGVMGQFGGVVMLVVLSAVAVAFALRLGIVLPAVSLDRPMSFRQAWGVSRGRSGTILGLALLVGLLNVVLLPLTVIIPVGPIGIVFDFVVQLVVLLVGVSLLTTLYGICVEGRELT